MEIELRVLCEIPEGSDRAGIKNVYPIEHSRFNLVGPTPTPTPTPSASPSHTSSRDCFVDGLRDALHAFPKIAQARWPLWIFIGVTFESINQYFLIMQKLISPEAKNHDSVMFLSQLGSVTLALAYGGIMLMTVPYTAADIFQGAKIQPILPRLREVFLPLFIGSMRAFGIVVLWLFMFIIPGVIKYFRLCLFPYVIMFSPSYRSGEVDYLKESERLVKGYTMHLFSFIAILGISTLILQVVKMKVDLTLGMPQALGVAALMFFILLLDIFVYTFCYHFYRHLSAERPFIKNANHGGNPQ